MYKCEGVEGINFNLSRCFPRCVLIRLLAEESRNGRKNAEKTFLMRV